MVKGISSTLLQSSLDSSRSSSSTFMGHSTGGSSSLEFHSARSSVRRWRDRPCPQHCKVVNTPDDDTRKQSRDTSSLRHS